MGGDVTAIFKWLCRVPIVSHSFKFFQKFINCNGDVLYLLQLDLEMLGQSSWPPSGSQISYILLLFREFLKAK